MQEYNSPRKTEARGAEFAGRCAVEGRLRGKVMVRELERAEGVLRRACDAAGRKGSSDGAARWLCENIWFLRRSIRQIALRFQRERLRRSGGKWLLLSLGEGLVGCCGGRVTAEDCAAFLRGFQSVLPLTEAELRLFPDAIRAALLFSLSALFREGEPDESSVAVLIRSLRSLEDGSLVAVAEEASTVERIFRQDPAGVYPQMDRESRAAYRRQVETLARRRSVTEERFANRMLRQSREASDPSERHVGRQLRQEAHRRARRGGGYVAANVLLTLSLSVASGFRLRSAPAALLLLLPISEIVRQLLDLVLGRFTPPCRLPRLELREGVPDEGRTICVISVLLTKEAAADEAARRLEEFYLANRDCGDNLLFGLLCDLPGCEEESREGDRALLCHAAEAVDTLNRRWGGGFYLLTRPRRYNRSEGRWEGWERKRGALLSLARLLGGEETELVCPVGDLSRLRQSRFILTLDEDTRLSPGSARALIGAMLHPLCRPVVDPVRGIVTEGFGILQPRISTELGSSGATDFARLFSGQGGLSSYGGCAGEYYMDRFQSGGFAGKGLIDAEALRSVMPRHVGENEVLSHDALEGAFLRAGLMEDVEVTDAFPASPLSWQKRQRRWVRGDWQNLPWLLRRGRVLPPIERWRLFDSLRRSLLPTGFLLSILSGLFFPVSALIAASCVGAAALFFDLLSALLRTLLQREADARLRLLSHVLHGFPLELTRALLSFILLPWRAWIGFSAAVTALWRMGVTRRGLLEWQTAAESEAQEEGGLRSAFRAMRSSLVVGVLCLFAPTVAGKAAGIVWLLAPLFASSLSRPRAVHAAVDGEDRAYLLERAGEIWKYFSDFCTAEEHYLPPDNYQETPGVGTAHRTSPTNVGLAMVSCLAALDLGIVERKEAVTLLQRMISTVESMPKWHGHLYNWTDTRTLRPLSPPYISTVDSGNLAAALLTVRQGLEEYGCTALAARADALYRAMDFTPLYDERRQLFRIGLTPGGERGEENHYDLLESEARLTAYVAVASGQVPLRCWKELSRSQVSCDGYRGCVSWSGTMFEYLMPELFLPLYRDSLLYESARFCLYVQRRQRFGRYRVWGKSESAFFALDAALNYHYKAHGCQRLALCRGMDRERVAAPYASFLALMLAPRAAVANLRNLGRLGALGPYGFWEAVDFTPGRTGREPRIVRCVMAHHLGMSLAAIDNALCGDVLRRRFFAESAMAAHAALLQEKIPLGGVVLQHRTEEPPLPRSTREDAVLAEGESVSFLRPACTLLSNGVYNIMSTESGIVRASCGSLRPYRSPRALPGEGHGMELWLQMGERRLSLLPGDDQGSRFRWRFTPGDCRWEGENGSLRWSVRLSVPPNECGERREITVRGLRRGQTVELFCSFEPMLSSDADYYSQIAYRRMGLRTVTEEDRCLISRPGGEKGQTMHLCFAAAEHAEYSGDFFRFPTRNGGAAFVPNEGWQSAPCCTARISLSGKESRVTVALAMGTTESSAREAADHILRERSVSSMTESAAALLGMDRGSVQHALSLLPSLAFPALNPLCTGRESGRRDALWKHGISGDLPLVAVELSADTESLAAAHVRSHALISACALSYDLVFLCGDLGEYRRGRSARLQELIRALGREQRIGAKGGIHFLPLECAADIRGAAAVYEDGRSRPEGAHAVDDNFIMFTVKPVPDPAVPPEYEVTEEGVTLTLRGLLPKRSWSHMACSPRFGALFTECGPGFLWYKNARECPLTPWGGDALAVRPAERLEVYSDGRWQSVFAAPGEDCTVRWGFGSAVWEKEIGGLPIRVACFVPREGTERVMTIECGGEARFRWLLPLQLGSEWGDGRFVRVTSEDGHGFRAESDRCPTPGTVFRARWSVPLERVCTDGALFLSGGEGTPQRSASPCFGGEFTVSGKAVLRLGVGRLDGDCPDEAAVCEDWRRAVTALTGRCGDPLLDHLLSGWSQYQALCARIYGRTSLYQSGGAWGCRDQLQDYVNLLPLASGDCRAHILRCCAHQYEEGDVQHWWHEGVAAADKGVRTRCSDDLLWLVWAVCEYAEKTGDTGILQERTPYLYSAPLGEDEDSRYETPSVSALYESVEEHCRRALELVIRRGKGSHGLLLMGSGDWNDGLSGMGEGAESVWLCFFFADCARRFAALLTKTGGKNCEQYYRAAREAAEAADSTWNGEYWPRGYYGDGEELGVLDAVVQSFGALCPDCDPAHGETALRTAMERLWDREQRIFRLSDPPYGSTERSPGYITRYGPGFRENGGQYTHAALFFAHALFRRGMAQEGAELLRCAAAEGRNEDYGGEPYGIPADISACPDAYGRAGWSWYTGSAGWFFRVALEDLLGFRMKDGSPEVLRCAMVPGWEDFRVCRRENGEERIFLPYSSENS